MCGRFMADDTVWEEVRLLVGWLDLQGISNGDVCPSMEAVILCGSGDALAARRARWGYEGKAGRLLINARAETVRERPSFRRDFECRRCVIPARGFYEWNCEREKFFFFRQEPVLYLAGIYSQKGQQERFTVLTTAANASMRPVHGRMPLFVPKGEIGRWTGEAAWAEDFLKQEPLPLLREKEKPEYEQLSLF